MNRYICRTFNKSKILLCLILILILFSSCTFQRTQTHPGSVGHNAAGTEALHSDDSRSSGETAQKSGGSAVFRQLCDELFIHLVTSDAITLNYTLSSPESYGIQKYPDSPGSCSTGQTQAEYAYYENKLGILKSTDRDSLTSDEKITYDTLVETLSSYLDIAPFYMYEEPLSPVSGIHVQLPVLLCEYHFYDEKAILDYFRLIENIPDYFAGIITFETNRRSEGIFMGTELADKIITECRDFIRDPGSNMLIQVFPENISNVSLSDASRSEYIARNEQLIREVLIPAYQSLIDGLKSLAELEHTAAPAMCSLPDGKEYYAKLVHIQTGSDMKPEAIKSLLEQTIKDCRTKIAAAILDNPDAYEKLNDPSYAADSPDDIINYLSRNITSEYPALPADAGGLNIKYVHSSLENTLSPAMYITPPIDCDVTDDIYINRSCLDDSTMFPTLAHEGYPGHLYQYEYFMSTGPHPIRHMLNFGGYSEGWATYAEMYSYDIAGIDKTQASILKNNKLATLCMYSMLDLGIHYYGWSYDECQAYLSDFGIENRDSVDEIYETIIAEPALYLKYTLGCLEFMQLESDIRSGARENYNPVLFHRIVLETGPTWFGILRDNVENIYLGY